MGPLQKELKGVEETHGSEVLNLVMARGYLSKLFASPRVSRYLGQHYADLFVGASESRCRRGVRQRPITVDSVPRGGSGSPSRQ